ncbi:hypothetical protein DFJ58DRAFT_745113 [Suillus subalutaceus]|uniref:uncharacterized protein n=1 Tax=Suillus subalutaceus TaxID=48586 RepID=UPI001B86F0A7|nr:uncharacterized protein DFJ58DRAFT_745113 [Suillus subalutaceus]KAG1857399.1 hypothetical protein DFJ58DRAFT_745113 [Suillus subalutaceus]
MIDDDPSQDATAILQFAIPTAGSGELGTICTTIIRPPQPSRRKQILHLISIVCESSTIGGSSVSSDPPLNLRSLMSEQEVAGLLWNNYVSVPVFTVMSYEYLLLLDKEVKYVWGRPWSIMSFLYLVVRYFGLFLALLCGLWGGLLYMPESSQFSLVIVLLYSCKYIGYGLVVLIEWGFSVYFCFAEAILIWRLYALCNQSKLLLYVLVGLFLPIVALSIGTDIYLYSRRNVFSVKEIITPHAKYCTLSYNIGPMPAIYTSIPIVCYDVLLVVLAAAILVRHLRQQRGFQMRANTYMVMIVRYHIMYFALNLTNQILLVILWAHIPTPAMSLSELFNDTAPFILAPRLIISIWDTHAQDNCAEVSKPFEDCVCWTSPPRFDSEQQEMDSVVV